MKKQEEKKEIKARVLEIVQREKHPETGEILLTEREIRRALEHETIKEWAYVLHDKDVDKDGKPITPHWHIVLSCPTQVYLSSVAKWFGVPENYVRLPKGRGAFQDCVAYLTHEETEKHVYNREDVRANFDIEEFWRKRIEQKTRQGKGLSESEEMFLAVLEQGKTLNECKAQNPLIYANNLKKLQMLRNEYLLRQEPPRLRINIYITGGGGIGKDLLSVALARSFYPDAKYDEDIFFCVGAKGAAFEGYDGQPVLIWSDRRAIDLIMELNGRGNVFDVFDSHPRRGRQNVKYSSVALNNSINIINAVEPYREFLDGLAGEYVDRQGDRRQAEDKAQSYRRFPIILELDAEAYNMLVNQGWLDDNNAFLQYAMHGRFVSRLRQLSQVCGENKETRKKVEMQTAKPVVEMKEKFEEKAKQQYTEEEILAMFSDAGQRIEPKKEEEKQMEFLELKEGEESPWA